jgi:hypothetical protein
LEGTSLENKNRLQRSQGCLLVTGALVLACALLVILPTGYAVYRYRAAQIYAGTVAASNKTWTLPTQKADSYTLTLQPQSSAPGGMTLGFTLQDSFGRTLASSTDFYTTGCPSSNAPQESCPAQSRSFPFNDTLGGPVHIILQSTLPNAQINVQVRDESAGGLFASGSLVIFGAIFGCGSLLWIFIAVFIAVYLQRSRRGQARPGQTHPNGQEGSKA